MASSSELENLVADLNHKYRAHKSRVEALGRQRFTVEIERYGSVTITPSGQVVGVQLNDDVRFLSERALADKIVAAVREAEHRVRDAVEQQRRAFQESMR
ncbi:hypothetical protein Lesp02_55750 [Lentzea sp. NBRC 105346]|uniref:YbaB/EbfC family nucleoid-associated protein n=1 Tax=Lentzea sp. NBRC 105346 TaxID=3032205 RepID=UPI00249FCF17|nr:YbaB/EbfC family nucleoid-associated protein [Lentzea sp. NBRC 105346]GLZ33387.1 hypothetical protein Lesp02_55750 [Lentzea sp. NBRC 105346]